MNHKFKNPWPLCLCSLVAVSVFTGPARAQPANGGFEMGNFSGWTLELPRVASGYRPGKTPVGTAQVVSTSAQLVSRTPNCLAEDGNIFAALGTLDRGNFQGERTFNVTLSQKLSLAEHDTVSGWAAFFNGDSDPQDSAWVKILDAAGNVVANPWREYSGRLNGCDLNSAPYLGVTPWTQWQWQAPADGLYTVSLGVTTSGNNNFASYGFFDDICAQASSPAVPEPSALALGATGTLLLAGRRLRGQYPPRALGQNYALQT